MKYSVTRILIPVILMVLFSNFALRAGADNEEEAVKAILIAFQQSWNQHDMETLASLFADDADFVNVLGMRWVGRAAIKDAHVQSHNTIFKNSQLTVNETIVRFLKPDVAVTRSFWSLVGHTAPTGEPGQPRKGIVTNVLVKQNEKWQIIVAQNTDIVSTQ
jgi:uncharacterized protein (TIGR02246 family)